MLVIIGGFVYWFGCSLLFSFFLLLYFYIYFKFFFLFSLFVSVYVYVSLCDFVYLVLLLAFDLGFYLLIFLSFFFFQAMWLAGSWCLLQVSGLSPEVRDPSPGYWTTRDLLAPCNISQ